MFVDLEEMTVRREDCDSMVIRAAHPADYLGNQRLVNSGGDSDKMGIVVKIS